MISSNSVTRQVNQRHRRSKCLSPRDLTLITRPLLPPTWPPAEGGAGLLCDIKAHIVKGTVVVALAAVAEGDLPPTVDQPMSVENDGLSARVWRARPLHPDAPCAVVVPGIPPSAGRAAGRSGERRSLFSRAPQDA